MRFCTALFLALASVSALAQDDYRGPYVGLGISQIDYGNNFMIWFDVSETDVVPRLVAGFRFSEKLAFEAVYNGSADFSSHMTGTVPVFLDSNGDVAGGGPYTADYTGSFESTELRVLAHAGKRLVLGAGLFMSDFEGRLVGSSAPIPPFDGTFEGRINDSDNGYVLMLGMQFDVGNWGIRPSYEYYGVSSPASASWLSVQLSYRF